MLLTMAFAFITVSLMLELLICKLRLPYLHDVWQVTVIRQRLTGSGCTTMAVYYELLMLLLNAAAYQWVFSTFVTKNKVSSTWLDIHLYVTMLHGQWSLLECHLICLNFCRKKIVSVVKQRPFSRHDRRKECHKIVTVMLWTHSWRWACVDTCWHTLTHADTAADWLSKLHNMLLSCQSQQTINVISGISRLACRCVWVSQCCVQLSSLFFVMKLSDSILVAVSSPPETSGVVTIDQINDKS